MKKTEKSPNKKTYQKPQLVVYGNIRTLTMTAGAGMMLDMSVPKIATA